MTPHVRPLAFAFAFLSPLLIAPVFHAAEAATTLPLCGTALPDPLVIDLSTGRDAGGAVLPFDAPDPRWSAVSVPPAFFGSDVVGTLGPAHTFPHFAGVWIAPPADAQYVNAFSVATASDNANAGGTDNAAPSRWPPGVGTAVPYVYETTFQIDLTYYRDIEIHFNYTADDYTTFELNAPGNALPSTGNGYQDFMSMHPLDYAAGTSNGFFVSGPNVLRASVVNDVAWTGLLVKGALTADCVEPAAEDCAGVPDYTFDVTTGSAQSAALPLLASDDDWVSTSRPLATPPGAVDPTSRPATTIRPHPAWVLPPPQARWVNAYTTTDPLNALPGGTYAAPTALPPAPVFEYEITFTLDLATYANPRLAFDFAADDRVVFTLNGLPNVVPIPPGPAVDYTALRSTVYAPTGSNGFFVNGMNVLRASVANDIIYTGLLVAGEVRAECRPAGESCDGVSDLEIDLTTGVANGTLGPIGSADDDWLVVKRPQFSPPGSFNTAQFPPSLIQRHNSWIQEPALSRWVNPFPTGAVGNSLPGGTSQAPPSANGGSQSIPYEYEFDFLLDLNAWENPRILLNYSADDRVTFTLNGAGNALNSPPFVGYSMLASLAYAPGGAGVFQHGANVLTASVTNDVVWTALLVVGKLVATCKERHVPVDPCVGVVPVSFDVVTGSGPGGPGTADPLWTVVSYPGQPAFNQPAHEIPPRSGAWVAGIGAATWVNPWPATSPFGSNSGSGGTTAAPTGATPYVYRFEFTLDLAQTNDVAIDLSYASDDDVRWFVNGQLVAQATTNTYNLLHALHYAPGPHSGEFVTGVNALEAHVTNDRIVTGLVADGHIEGTCVPVEPACKAGDTLAIPIGTGTSNGTAIAPGAPDPRWTVELVPGAPGPFGPAHAIPANPAWVAAPAGSMWVNPWTASGMPGNHLPGGTSAAPTSQSTPPGSQNPYKYALAFHLDLDQWGDVEIHAKYAADDRYVLWRLNQGPSEIIGQFTTLAYAALHALDYVPGPSNGKFMDGPNVLTVEFYNDMLYTGLVVVGEITATCKTRACNVDIPLNTALDASGLVAPIGALEPRWQVTSSPSGWSGTPRVVTPEPWWSTRPDAGWISAGSSGAAPPIAAAGTWKFAIEFIVPCEPVPCDEYAIDLDLLADATATAKLNGAALALAGFGGPEVGNTFHGDGCGTLTAGVNRIEVTVVNTDPDGNGVDPMGLLVVGSVRTP